MVHGKNRPLKLFFGAALSQGLCLTLALFGLGEFGLFNFIFAEKLIEHRLRRARALQQLLDVGCQLVVLIESPFVVVPEGLHGAAGDPIGIAKSQHQQPRQIE